MSAVLPLTLRLLLKRGNTLQAPSTTTDDATSATAAPASPSADATLTALAWVCTAGQEGAAVRTPCRHGSGQRFRRFANPAFPPAAATPTVLFTDHRAVLEQAVHKTVRRRRSPASRQRVQVWACRQQVGNCAYALSAALHEFSDKHATPSRQQAFGNAGPCKQSHSGLFPSIIAP